MKKICAFVGHRNTKISQKLKDDVLEQVIKLVFEQDVERFVFARSGNFDNMCFEIVTNLQKYFSFIKIIDLSSSTLRVGDVDDEILRALITFDTQSTYNVKSKKIIDVLNNVSIFELYKKMIDLSSWVVFYFDLNSLGYLANKKVPSSNEKSETFLAYRYALQNAKNIINMCKK